MANEQSQSAIPIDLPYAAVSVNGRGEEWQVPLWDAINRIGSARLIDRAALVVMVHEAVETAMRIAIEETNAKHCRSCCYLQAPCADHDGKSGERMRFTKEEL